MATPHSTTRAFFDGLARTYDQDVVAVGWDAPALIQSWPFVVPPGGTFLDVGCGTGAILELMSGADRQLIGMDLAPEMIARARRRRPLKEAELYALSADAAWPLEDATVDAAVALAMLEFIPELDEAFDELARVLRPWGSALVTVEDIVDWHGNEHPAQEMRYGEFPLWRRTREDIELAVPPGLNLVRVERRAGYTVLEEGYTCAYWVIELQRNDWYPA